MSRSQNLASVLVQHSAPPPHTLTSPFDPELVPEPPSQMSQPSIERPMEEDPPHAVAQPEPEAIAENTGMDVRMTDAPPAQQEPASEILEEAAETAQERQQDGAPSEEPPQPTLHPLTVADDAPADPTPPPPPAEPQAEIPEWVLFEEDTSKPCPEEEEELKRRELQGTELSALDVPAVEKRIYTEVDDPEIRPVKKLRLSWVIKGVRGTKEKPNHARVMVSPPAYVDGRYWQVKFYPRGNRTSSYSAYIRCTRKHPGSDRQPPDSIFSYFEGPPEANFGGDAVPICTVKTEPVEADGPGPSVPTSSTPESTEKADATGSAAEQEPEPAEPEGDKVEVEQATAEPVEEDWRLSCQLGVVLFNPEEPRSCAYISSEHQFSQLTDDWGWSNVVGPWQDMHMRQHLQRAPLLQNDTIAIDAYVRVFDDPTKALWWRSSDNEPHWDAKSLAGYFPMGTPPLYHSPGVAGMTALLLLAPFRKVLQSVDTGKWLRDSQIRPSPFLAQLQIILFWMRKLKKEHETYVDVYPALQALKDVGEEYTDVKTFWEAFRRSIELELDGDEQKLGELKSIFDSPSGAVSLPALPVENVLDVQSSLSQILRDQQYHGVLPNFLPLQLGRDRFDKKSRVWKLLHDRVILNEELDLSDFSLAEHAKYTLYGFMVHTGARSSGKIYTVLRPNGPGTMWLAFEDGDGNQVFSYSKKNIQTFEGLEGQALKDFNSVRATAYMAMYIKTSCLDDYLPGSLEPYKLPKWLEEAVDEPHQVGEETSTTGRSAELPENVKVEVYCDEGLRGREGLLDMYNIQLQSKHKGFFHLLSLPRKTTFQALRAELAEKMACPDTKAIRLFTMSYSCTGGYSTAQMTPVNLSGTLGGSVGEFEGSVCLWLSTLRNEEQIELFGVPDKSMDEVVVPDPAPCSETSAETRVTEELQVAAADIEQASVEAAVASDIERTSLAARSSVAAVEVSDPDTPMQLEATPPSAEESLTADVPHGHLVDAVSNGNNPLAVVDVGSQDVQAAVVWLSPAGVDVIGTAIAHTSDAMDVVINSESALSDSSSSQSASSASQALSSPSQPEAEIRPVIHGYGFIQIFDVDKQTFRVEGAFFAKMSDKVREFLVKFLGYGPEKDIVVWRRFSTAEGSIVTPGESFGDIGFVNGSDLVVYEALDESKARKLASEGKFSNPHDLSKYLRMVERRHPIQSKTSEDPVEVADFGCDYYQGPLKNGRYHGANCVSINSAGNVYEGPLLCNVKSGKGGKMTYCNGDTYEGEWVQDERHGQGTFVEARTGNKYVGGFENGKRWGMGTTYWQVADEQADLCQICYCNEIDALFFDCGHVCACVECSRQCEICPICRKTVKQVVKMFRA